MSFRPITAVADVDILSSGGVQRLYRSGFYYTGEGGSATTTGIGNAGTGEIRFTPIYIGRALTVDRIAVAVATTKASTHRLGIYNDNGFGKPGTLRLDAGNVSTGSQGVKEIVINHALEPGLYWLAVLNNDATGGASIRAASATIMQPVAGEINVTVEATTTTYCYAAEGVGGAFPDPYVGEALKVNPPSVFIRIA